MKKHLRAQEVALENHLPCVYLVDSGGAFLPLQAEVFPDREHFGRIFYNQARLSAQGIPQIARDGLVHRRGAYVPAMSDETVIVRARAPSSSPGPLVRARPGRKSAPRTWGALVHTRTSGVADHLAENDDHALAIVRRIVSFLGVAPAPAPRRGRWPRWSPRYDPAELYGIVPRTCAPPSTCGR